MPIGIYQRKPRGNYIDPDTRFNQKINKLENGCWIWKGKLDRDGYGRFSPYRNIQRAHRYSYEKYVGKIPKGYAIDHLCRNRACVNPKHLEPVTNIENIMRGFGYCALNARKTHCSHGHELLGKNLYVQKKTGKRYCRLCDRRRHENAKNKPTK